MCCILGLREQISLQKIGHRQDSVAMLKVSTCIHLPGDESCESLSGRFQMHGPSGRDGSCTALLSSLPRFG